MNCVIIEDQPPAQRLLKKYIDDIGTLELKATFSDPIRALEFLKSEPVDLLFLDVHLPKISGIDFLRTMTKTPYVILTTAFSDYALESYEFSVVDYLLKPFSFQRFVKAVSKVPPKQEVGTSDAASSQKAGRREVYIKSGYEHIKITLEHIRYIKSDADYTEIFLTEKRHLSSEPLRYWFETLDPNQFVRIHKSFIINTTKIARIAGNQIFLDDETVIPIGRAYKESFIQRFVK